MDQTFQFDLRAQVSLSISGEIGKVIARAEYSESSPQYLIEYKAADGRAVTAWWPASSLTAAN